MKREDDSRGPLKADALRGFFEFQNETFGFVCKNLPYKRLNMI